MNLFELTRALVDIESTTTTKNTWATTFSRTLSAIAARHNGQIERIPVELNRDNVFACWGGPIVTFSTHMDTVPPFFASHEDNEFIWGRGSCDAKGIMASMIAAAEKLLAAARGISACYLLSARNETAPEQRPPPQILAARDFLLMASPPRTASLSVARARCVTNHRGGKAGAFRVSGTRSFRDSHAPRCPPRHSPDSTA